MGLLLFLSVCAGIAISFLLLGVLARLVFSR
jgi:hypothetical protein